MSIRAGSIRGVEEKLLTIFLEWASCTTVGQAKVLDLGCGIGTFAKAFAKEGFEVTALEIDYQSLRQLRGDEAGAGIAAVCGDATTRVFRRGVRFDIVIASEVLEHLAHPEKALSQINEHLSAEGIAIITIPNGYGPWELYERLLRRPRLHRMLYAPFRFLGMLTRAVLPRPAEKLHLRREHCTLNLESPHLHFWTLRQFRALLARCGLEILEMRKSNISYTWVPYYYRLRNKVFDAADARLADFMPAFMVSGWAFKVAARSIGSGGTA